jgi:hypothetical protein
VLAHRHANPVSGEADDPARRWGFVFAIARTWKTVEDKAIKDLVTHLPRTYYPHLRRLAVSSDMFHH